MQGSHYDWARQEGLELSKISSPEEALSEGLDLVVTFDNYHMPAVEHTRFLVKNDVPVLTLADGILEYRNTYENPQIVPGSLFQPALGHKIACIGRSQGRILEAWGNIGKCEVVGVPRFDRLLGRHPRNRKPGDPFRLLIMTAKNPGFTPEQLKRARDGLKDLHFAIRHWIPKEGMSRIEPIWRLTAGLADDLGISNSLRDTSGADLADTLETIDAVVTTPSTVMLEGMLQGIPVALLDYTNCPQYVPSAWSITAKAHITGVLQELQAPPAAKILFQQTVLHDSLESRTPATPRLVQLIQSMARIGRECRELGKTLQFPQRILCDQQQDHHLPEETFDLRRLYPEHPVFANMDRTLLQIEVSHLRRELANPRQELRRLRESYEKSVSLKLGRILTWPLRKIGAIAKYPRT